MIIISTNNWSIVTFTSDYIWSKVYHHSPQQLGVTLGHFVCFKDRRRSCAACWWLRAAHCQFVSARQCARDWMSLTWTPWSYLLLDFTSKAVSWCINGFLRNPSARGVHRISSRAPSRPGTNILLRSNVGRLLEAWFQFFSKEQFVCSRFVS